jgi:PPOX class probable F420-dependent enzyme
VDEATMRRRVAEARVGRLATVGADGAPHIVPCCFVLHGDTVFSAVDGKPKSTRALRRLDNVRAEPRATLLVDFYDEDWTALWWVRVDANARVIDGSTDTSVFTNAVELLQDKYEQYRREPPAGPVVALEITRWRAWP